MYQKSKSAFSLPKIKQLPEQSQQPQSHQIFSKTKLLKEIHRPKWGMAPKCLIKGHQGKQILYVCIHPNCQQTTRLICQDCFYANHQKHNTQCLAVDQIKRANIEELRFWPFASEFKKMFEFVTKHESYVNNVVQDVNQTFNEMVLRIINAIDKIRLNVLKNIDNFYIKQTTKKTFADKLKVQLQQSFDLKKIQKTVSDLFNKKIKHSVFDQKMRELLNNQQILNKQKRILEFFQKSDKGIDIEFDKQFFLKKQEQLLKSLVQQQESIKQIQVVIGEQKQMKKIIPEALKYLQIVINGVKDLKFQKKILQDNSEYVGFYHRGVKSIIGMRKYKSGFVYYGEWSNDTRNGWGIFENKNNGYKYIGNWKQDRKHGFGREETLVTIYEGEFKSDKKQGFGVFIKDGNRYEVAWKNDKMHGEGKVIKDDGMQNPIYFYNGIQTQTKNQKVNGSMNLSELTKKFTKSTNSKSTISQTNCT